MIYRNDNEKVEDKAIESTEKLEPKAKAEVDEKHIWNTPSKLWRPERPTKISWKIF